MKATQGTSFLDPRFEENWTRSRDAGVQRGAYHFFDPSEDAAAQASHFLKTAKLEPGDLPPALDIEMMKRSTLSTTLEGISTWLTAVQAGTGRTPIIYTSASFWQQLGNPPNPGDHPLWVAHYGVAVPHLPAGVARMDVLAVQPARPLRGCERLCGPEPVQRFGRGFEVHLAMPI